MSYQQIVEAHHKVMFTDNVKMVAQQLANPLRGAVTIVPASGEAQSVADLYGAKKGRQVADGDRSNPDNPTPRGRRWLVRPNGMHDGEVLDKQTKFDAAMDPTSNLLRSNVASVERMVHDAILGIVENVDGSFALGEGGIFGAAREGKRGDSVVAFPPAQIIAHGGTGLTMDKLRTVRKSMKKKNFGIERTDPIFGYITPEQEDDLLGIAAATGANLNSFNVEQLREGKPSRLLGIDWLMGNRLPINAAGTARMVPFWSKENVVAGMWQDVDGRMWNDSSKQNLPYIYVDAFVDATRVEDGGVFVLECVED